MTAKDVLRSQVMAQVMEDKLDQGRGKADDQRSASQAAEATLWGHHPIHGTKARKVC